MENINPNLRDIRLNPSSQDGLELDVAIVGAGVSGLYSAYRLKTGEFSSSNDNPKLVHVFEMSDRIAGRLESVFLPGMVISGELGGMRYLSSQQIVTQLIENVFSKVLKPIEFPMGDPADLLFYLRKQRFRANSWSNAQQNGTKFETRYYLNNNDIGFSADQLFNKIIYDVLTADPWFVANYGIKVKQTSPYDYTFTLTSRDWDAIKPQLVYHFNGPYNGLKVNDMGFWNLVKDQVSEEGYAFLDEAGGYYSNTINWNAAEAFPYMIGDFSGVDVTYRTIEGGYDLIAYALAYYYLQTDQSEIWINNRLVTITPPQEPDGYFDLLFENTNSGENWHVLAKKVVLAMPRRSLELLDQDGFLFQDPRFRKNLESVIMEPSFKLLMGFEYPWWKDLIGATSGHSITDLPMRQCYYFGSDPDDTDSLFLASYNDMRTVTFWKALDDQHPQRFAPKKTKLFNPASFTNIKYKASQVMIDEAMNQVRELHGSQNIPEPFIGLFKDWSDDPFGGGYHAWKAAYDIAQVMQYMRHPYADKPLFICGEAYSDQQGWVEGAFCEAEKILQQKFFMLQPAWLPKTYYLGW
ncbi:FAD-dependent oxidoreductase [Cytophagaceae bacterium YF14B1]|uniref:Tryptophan 2-monooxygenase n=1 Tax=Xanthocytophaga flava TaxID=3048013 RepID=A0AAE3QVC9_9BACT|nr:FAD-dependent oxidoreductase [Xanthocytophaga flavus]MDJ1483489.1 FAD-dependent oxidoreductase [Xanthocytophaga flavus]